MDFCDAATRTAENGEDLAAFVEHLRHGGAQSVVVGVVGPGLGRVRRAVGDLATVYSLSVPATTAPELAGADVFPVQGRCVVVVRERDVGWDLAVAVPRVREVRSLAAAPPPVPREHHPFGIDGGAFAWTLLGEFGGAGLGFGSGLALSSGCDYSNCDLYFAILGACAGSWAGSVVGGASIRPHHRPAAGAIAGSALSAGLLIAAFDSSERTSNGPAVGVAGSIVLVSLAVVAPPMGAAIAVGSSGDGPAATVSWRW